jgi:hypothetical protein
MSGSQGRSFVNYGEYYEAFICMRAVRYSVLLLHATASTTNLAQTARTASII